MSSVKNSQKLKGKDLITIGIFTAIYFVLTLISNMLGGIHAIVWFLTPAIAGLVAATPFMLLCAKVKKPFATLIFGTVVGLIYLATSMFHVAVPIVFVIGALIAEIIRYATHYDNYWGNSIAYCFVALGMAASPLPLWINPKAFIQKIKDFGMPDSYIETCESFTSPGMLIAMVLVTIVFAFIGAVVAKALFKKHFVKAGVVS